MPDIALCTCGHGHFSGDGCWCGCTMFSPDTDGAPDEDDDWPLTGEVLG